jgi:hypothetical protein
MRAHRALRHGGLNASWGECHRISGDGMRWRAPYRRANKWQGGRQAHPPRHQIGSSPLARTGPRGGGSNTGNASVHLVPIQT